MSAYRTVQLESIVLARWSDLLATAAEELQAYALGSADLVESVITEINDALLRGE